MTLRQIFAIFICVWTGPASGQSLSLQDLADQVDDRAQTLDGYLAFLTDPDPARAMAALQIMLETGDPILVQMALSVGIYSGDPQVRQTALRAFLESGPTLGLALDTSNISEEASSDYSRLISALGGSVGLNGTASLSYKVDDWSNELGCYLNSDFEGQCLARVNQTSLSIMLPEVGSPIDPQWINLWLEDDGALRGSTTLRFGGRDVGTSEMVLRLVE